MNPPTAQEARICADALLHVGENTRGYYFLGQILAYIDHAEKRIEELEKLALNMANDFRGFREIAKDHGVCGTWGDTSLQEVKLIIGFDYKKNITMNIPNMDDSWAQAELYRWEHGELPPQDHTCKKLNEAEGLRKMADAIEEGCRLGDTSKMPSPFNVCAVLRYFARRVEASGINNHN